MGTDPPLPAKNLIELTCWDCGTTWTIQRRRLLERGGADVMVERHETYGWRATVPHPKTGERVPVLDLDDVRWVLVEQPSGEKEAA